MATVIDVGLRRTKNLPVTTRVSLRERFHANLPGYLRYRPANVRRESMQLRVYGFCSF